MSETPELGSTQAIGLTEVIIIEKVTKSHACLTAKGVMDVYQGHISYITIANFGKVDLYVLKRKKVGEVAITSLQLVWIKDEHFLYRSGAKVNKPDNRVSAVH